MRSLIVVSLLAAAGLCGFHAKTGAYPDAWEDLFPPPFTNAPMIMEGIGCVGGGLCYIPAGDNGVGFQIMQFDGQFNGEFTILNTPEAVGLSVYSTLGAGGSPSEPHGLATGMGIPAGRYNATEWLAPAGLLMAMSIDVRYDTKSGQNVGLYNGLNPESWCYSNDGGMSFSFYQLDSPPLPNPDCMWARYSTFGGANANVVYQTFGNWPNNNNAMAKNSKRFRVDPHAEPAPLHLLPKRVQRGIASEACGYNAGITKSTDGGKTWQAVFSNTADYYFNQIDCVDEVNCVVVGGSFWNATGPTTGGRIYTTHNGGSSWNLVYHSPSNATYTNSLMSVRFSQVNSSEVWVGGAQEINGNPLGVMLKSSDMGNTWQKFETLDYVGEVLDMSFTKDGNAFASAITEFEDSTILRYNANGPAPTTAPPYTGLVSQYVCTDNACSQGCNLTMIPQQTCINVGDGTSAQFRCNMNQDVVINNQYPLSSTCTFVAEQSFFQIGACYVNPNGGTILFQCGSGEEELPMKPRRIVGKPAPIRTKY